MNDQDPLYRETDPRKLAHIREQARLAWEHQVEPKGLAAFPWLLTTLAVLIATLAWWALA